MSGEVPDGWQALPLSTQAEIIMGQSPRSEDTNQDQRGIPFFQGNGEFGTKHPQANRWIEAPLKTARRGDILFSVRAPVGEMNIADVDCCIGRGLCAIRARHCDPSFLFQALSFSRGALAAVSQGSTFAAVNKGDLGEREMLFPPLPEQHRIAEILSSVDEAIQATQAVIVQTRKVKEGVLQRLLTKGIGHTRFKQTEIGEVPDVWEVGTVADLGPIVTGKTPSTGSPEFWDGDIPFITPGDLGADFAWTRASGRTASELGATQAKPVERGAVLVTCIGSTIGKLGIASARCITNQQINAICSAEEVGPFVYAVAESLKGTLQNLSGKQAVPIVNKSTFQSIRIPLPPKHEQVAISAIVRSHWDQMETLVQTVATLEAIKASLMADLLTGRRRVSASFPLATE